MGKILSALMSSRSRADFCRNVVSSINQTGRLFSADSFEYFSADSTLEYFPRPGVSCCAPCDPIVVQSTEEKYRNTGRGSKYRKSDPLGSLHPDNRSR